MYAGRIVESGPVRSVLRDPRHPYTKGLLDSAPDFDHPDQMLKSIPGFPPNLADRSVGCSFAPRCEFAQPECVASSPQLEEVGPDRLSACFEKFTIFEGAHA